LKDAEQKAQVNNSSEGNCWQDEFTSEEVKISAEGQNASNPGRGWLNVFAKQGFSLADCRRLGRSLSLQTL
jgi:hypothetical protein